ncbi:MAG: class I SAM-dependent methyltransferase [Patescibacteria group bacterium]
MEEVALVYKHPQFCIELRCGTCNGFLNEQTRCCNACGYMYREEDGRPVFIDPADMSAALADQNSDSENSFKNFFKRWPRLYRFFVYLVAPVLFSGLSAKRFLDELPAVPERVLNIGSGPTFLHPNALNVDIFPFPNVHILARAERLPFADETFDVVCSEQMLEHVRQPANVARELIRVTKKGGLIYTATPYMLPLHPSPKDYSRWSIDGLHDLFDGCRPVKSGVLNGPVSGMLIVMAGGLAMIFSFGWTPLRKINNYLFMLLLSPFKLLDYLYAKLPGAEDVAGGLWTIVQKP